MSGIKRIVGKPAKAESFHWQGDFRAIPAQWRQLDMLHEEGNGILVIRTNRGPTPCYLGDYIIRRTTGDFYPVDAVTYAERWAEQ